jgi:hypothetical protein
VAFRHGAEPREPMEVFLGRSRSAASVPAGQPAMIYAKLKWSGAAVRHKITGYA